MPSKEAVRPFGRAHAITASTAAHKSLIPHVDHVGGHDANGLRLRRGAEHLCSLGGRATFEFLREIGNEHGIAEHIAAKLDLWRARLTPDLLRAVGGDRFPPLLAAMRGSRQ